MPPWSTFFGGPFTDQQVEQIVAYLLSIQTGEAEEAEAFVGASGEDVFQANCARCHGMDASGYVGPSLLDVAERFGGGDEAWEAIRSTIVNGRLVPTGAPMPAWGDKLTPDAIDRVVDYLRSIQQGEGSDG